MAVIPITSMSPSVLPCKGGVAFVIEGTFDTARTYTVYLGKNGSVSDEPCYSGIAGQAYACVPSSATELPAVSPPLNRHADLYLTVVSGADDGQLHGGIMAIEDTFADWMFLIRKQWPAWYITGPRNLTVEPRQDK